MSIICKLGFHDPVQKETWIPSLVAKIVTEVIFKTDCRRCKKALGVTHFKWDESNQEMVDVSVEKIV